MDTYFVNSTNQIMEKVSRWTWLWVLLFGPLYFAYRGLWSHALIHLGVSAITAGVAWLVYPIFAARIVRNYFRQHDWVEVPPGSISGPTVLE